MNRRQALLHVTAVVSLTGGCLSTTEQPTGTTSSKPQSPEPINTESQQTVEPEIQTLPQRAPTDIDCSEGDLEPVEIGDSDTYPERAGGFELTASTDIVTIGDGITFSLRNVSNKVRNIGVIYKYNIQRRKDGEWNPVYETPIGDVIDGIEHVAPGGGYDWPFTFDQEGLERDNGNPNGPQYYVCTQLTPGVYRFIYWGANETLATRFTVEQSD